MPLELSASDARGLAVAAQRLSGRRHRDPLRLLDELSAVQLDTISVVARSHELVAFARLGSVSREDLARAWWGTGRTFEYWAHAACLLPLRLWPLFAWRRRRNMQRYPRTPEQREVLARLAAIGPLTSADLGGARVTPGWWDWSPLKTAVEQLLARGDVVCTERRGFRRVYRLVEDAVAEPLRAYEPDDDACHAALVTLAARHLGVATGQDLADYFRLPLAAIGPAVRAAGLVPVTVPGWRAAWVDAAVLDGRRGAVVHRPLLLSPFDSLIWHRGRTERLFAFRHRLEAYTPAARREHGYFVMPLLANGRLVGRVDPKRDKAVLRVRRASVEGRSVRAMAEALTSLAAWVGCEKVVLDDDGIAPDVRRALRVALARS